MTSSDDVWRRAEERNKRDAYYRALTDRDPDRLVAAAASTEAYLHYLQLRDAREGVAAPGVTPQEDATPPPRALLSFAEAVAKHKRDHQDNLERLKHALFMAIDRSSLHPSEKRSYFQWLYAADLSSPATELEMVRMFASLGAQASELPEAPPG